MKKILVVTDFSPVAKNAALYAIELAKLSGANILLYNSSEANYSSYEISALEKNKDVESINRIKHDIEVDYLNKLSSVEVTLLVREDKLIGDILSIEKDENIDLVILGLKENDPINDSIFQNVVTALMKETIVPILIIPETINFKKIEKMVFTIDFNLEIELKMHNLIKKLLHFFNPEIFLLNVVKENEGIMPDKKVSEYNIEKYFENESHIYSFIENNDVISGLKDFISCNNIDMITMLPHKQNLLPNIFNESKTEKMVFNTTIPLIVFPLID